MRNMWHVLNLLSIEHPDDSKIIFILNINITYVKLWYAITKQHYENVDTAELPYGENSGILLCVCLVVNN